MRSAGVLGLGIATLLCLPAVAAVGASAAAHQVEAQTKIVYSADSGVSPTAEPTDAGEPSSTVSSGEGNHGESHGGNVLLTVPRVAFGADDSLPARLIKGKAYTAQVVIWVTPGLNGALATVFNGEHVCKRIPAPGGLVEKVSCILISGSHEGESSPNVRIEVRSASGQLLRSVTYAHAFTN